MALRAILLALVLAVPLLAGCAGTVEETPRAVTPADVGYDPSTIHVTGTHLVNATIPTWDGVTQLSAAIRSPLSDDKLPDGAAPRWPVVIFLHGWGGSKEGFMGGRGGLPRSDEAMQGKDWLAEFAQAGFVAVAYDSRGFGQSGGYADVAGQATMADFDSVLDWVEAHYPTNGKVGVLGQSYGAGQTYLAWAKNPRVTTAVAMYGWVDLADALIPNNVPKLEWAQFLYGYGLAGSRARYDPMIHQWYTQLYQRTDLDTVRAQMAERSALPLLGATDKPIFACQGLQETLFPQADRAWQSAGGFARGYVYTGGHSSQDPDCWSRALDWFHFFLAGFDTRVDSWPALETVDAAGGASVPYVTMPATVPETLHLRAPDLSASEAPEATFTVEQSMPNPTSDPSAISDLVGGPRQALPDALRTDPSATTFTSAPFQDGALLVGSATLRLHVESGPAPFQVAALLMRLGPDGSSQILGRAAFAALDQEDVPDGEVAMTFEWTHARLEPGDRIQLKVAANDSAIWMPLPANYSVTFDGQSALELPLA